MTTRRHRNSIWSFHSRTRLVQIPLTENTSRVFISNPEVRQVRCPKMIIEKSPFRTDVFRVTEMTLVQLAIQNWELSGIATHWRQMTQIYHMDLKSPLRQHGHHPKRFVPQSVNNIQTSASHGFMMNQLESQGIYKWHFATYAVTLMTSIPTENQLEHQSRLSTRPLLLLGRTIRRFTIGETHFQSGLYV